MRGAILVCAIGVAAILWWRSGPKPVDMNNVLHEYDFIVVGSGSSGGVVATRLSEDPSVTVLLVEAGPMDTSFWNAQIPALAPTMASPASDWGYYTAPQETGGNGFNGRKVFLPRGKILGGSSTVNWMYHTRCRPEDYDEWEAMGNPGWGYRDVVKYFDKLEGVTIEDLVNKGRNDKGPVGISYGLRSQFGSDLAQAIRESKLPFITDYNTEHFDGEGYFYVQANTKDGRRQSTAEAYIRPAMHRNNFHVVSDALATKVNFNADKEATGVTVLADRLTLEVRARKEVVLSAGAYNSPQVLMWSGIGPKDELKKAQVEPVYINNNVGAHLEDHLFLVIVLSTPEADSLADSPAFDGGPAAAIWLAKELTKYALLKGRSRLGKAVFEVEGMARSGVNKDLAYPDLQLYFIPSLSYDKEYLETINYNPQNVAHQSNGMNALPNSQGFLTIGACHLHPLVRGSVTLNNSDPGGPPVVDYQTVREQKDRDTLVLGLKKLLKLVSHPSLSKYNLTHPFSHAFRCKGLELLSDEYLRCVVDNTVTTVFHPTSTCRMGASEKDSVVDSRLRVHGVRRLRVADASIMPHVPSGNTNAPCMMIGEKAADLIKQDHGLER